MDKKFFIAWIVIFVAWFAGSFVVHGVLLHDDYAKLSNLFRTEADSQQFFHLMIVAHVMLSGAFVWIYARGAEDKPWVAQGLRFGIAVALLTVVPTYLIYYVVQPMPGAVVAKQIVFDGILMLILAQIAAFLYRQTGAVVIATATRGVRSAEPRRPRRGPASTSRSRLPARALRGAFPARPRPA